MKDQEFNELKLRASICPGVETDWAPPECLHWIALHDCANELRSSVGKTLAALQEVDADKNLSVEGKRLKREKLVTQTLDALKEPASLQKARDAVAAQMKRWQDKITAHVKPAADQAEAVLHSQVREKISHLKEGRLAFLQKHGADPVVASALLEAPPFLCNLSEPELALLRSEVEKKYLTPEIIEAKTQVGKALEETERSLRAAQVMIRKSAGPIIASVSGLPARVA